jgi:hypothetical protein
MSDTEALERRVAELERRMEILFSKTGAIDLEEAGRGATDASPEVEALLHAGKIKDAVKLYREQTGADMGQAMAALKKVSGT